MNSSIDIKHNSPQRVHSQKWPCLAVFVTANERTAPVRPSVCCRDACPAPHVQVRIPVMHERQQLQAAAAAHIMSIRLTGAQVGKVSEA
jgi:hypothetical protein